ncbi:hypothetical protein [Aurantiacibacter poecillastricola]|uniref:hypothetical protein n=1 Tax=Aurantiacibacter poecillastricola TaxID=3064385 RepID=UPI00273EA75C|nr:hypothetical protein [Aurantiacibacter sp. 219JJ12-13]MDP5262695.1 hypothetical protein [Aurantiacibacter sp. 219JJ12-13]
MTLAFAISAFFGFVAAIALLSCYASMRKGVRSWFAIRAELAAIDRGRIKAPRRVRQPEEAFTLLAA